MTKKRSKNGVSGNRNGGDIRKRVQSLLNEGARLLRQRRPAEAINHLERARELDPTLVEATINLGGAYVMQLDMDIASTSISDLQDCGRLVEFMEGIDLTNSAPHDNLITSGNAYALAYTGNIYLAYLPNGGTVNIDLSSASGALEYQWYNPRNGQYGTTSNVEGGATRSFTAPDSSDWALRIVRTSDSSTIVPPVILQIKIM